ncbi:hypothetical protein DL240_19290 [Lujinxingia litoralis]|uniref:Fumarylacetoacetase-like C-terminal domain-containing protein n=1 Tax=Lujinxingia litoralis TaxID=2211119 RepID=A0A328C0A2_9DELT|nr:fumarylacetoacetate hydrolase family protein [Lujinxingia litoralis]RAL19996.1 hypothetical protein DL240_19290 [Lujinxingia litoralis]
MNAPDPERVERAAQILWDAQFQHTPCAPLSQSLEGLSVAEAYAVQDLVGRWRGLRHGLDGRAPARLVGHKIGLTSEAIQSWLQVTEPDFGLLLSDMIVDDAGVASTSRLLQPRAEAEVAFVLGRDLSGPGVSVAQVVHATDYALAAIEIIDSRIADWKITYEDTIADNASSGLFVLGGSPRRLDQLDLRTCGMALRKNGRVVSTGAGAACLGHPLNAVAWLANKLGEFGQGLKAGQVILSGALGPVCQVARGDFLEAEISGLGRVSVRFGE